jgi:hypothetical protein
MVSKTKEVKWNQKPRIIFCFYIKSNLFEYSTEIKVNYKSLLPSSAGANIFQVISKQTIGSEEPVSLTSFIEVTNKTENEYCPSVTMR